MLLPDQDNPFYNIPPIVYSITIFYYYIPGQVLPFDPEYKSKCIVLTNNNKTASSPGGHQYWILAGGGSVTEGSKVWRIKVYHKYLYL